MPSSDLSVSELAQMTGLAIDSTWNRATAVKGTTRISVWCSCEWDADALLSAAPSSLPAESAVRVEFRRGDAVWDAEWPLAFDLHWLREITTGFPLGARPVRVWPASPVRAGVRLQGDFVTLVWRDGAGQTWIHVAVGCGDAAPAIALEARTPPPAGVPRIMDEVLRALTGSTSVEWLRGVFADSCSLAWKELAGRIGARPDQLDDLAMYFRALTTTEEDALWRAASTTGDLSELQSWLEVLASEQTGAFDERLHDELQREGASFWRGAAGEWLNATAGATMACLTWPTISARLAVSARKILAVLIRDDLASLLVRFHAAADGEWAVLAPWYRSRIAQSCGALGANVGSDKVLDEVSLWMKKIHERLHLESIEAACRRAREALSAAIVTPDSKGSQNNALVNLGVASSPEGDEVVDRVLHGDLRPCCYSSSGSPHGVRMLGGLLGHLHGRRIVVEVLLPFLQKRSWTTEREDLATAEIHQTGAGQLVFRRAAGNEDWSVERESAALLLSAVFTSRTEAPADDMIHMVHENRRTLQGNETDIPWLRMIGAYGLSVRGVPAGPAEATLKVEIPWNWAEAWCHAPLKRDAAYVDRFIQLSLTMQDMARHWLPALCLSTAEQFDTPKAVLPLLVYAASQPHVNRRKPEFGYDAMSPFSVERAAASASGRLLELLDPLHRSLKASSRSRTAEYYSPDRARLIISAVQRKPRALAALLAGDMFLLEHCFQLTAISRELRAVAARNPAQALRKLAQASEEIVKTRLRGIKRHYPNQTYDGLGVVYLLEATRMLAAGAGGAGFRASLTVATETGVQRFQAAA
jgi:hypothetical protein